MITEKSASSLVGGSRRTEHIRPEPRGSKFSRRRSASSLSWSHWFLSSSVLPGGTGTPPTITRVGFPSVWESTVLTILLNLTLILRSMGNGETRLTLARRII